MNVRFALVFALTACAPPSPGAPATFDDFCSTKFDPPTNAGQSGELARVAIEGWLVPPGMFSVCSDTCSFDLAEQADGSGRTIRYSVRFGDDKNRLAPLSEHFKPEDFKLRTQNDERLGFGDKVRLHGGRLGMAERKDCQLYAVDLIEKP
jgi:hypothetical protein